MNLAIIGCGNIGFRHFQSILNLKCNCQIFLIDNSVTALSNCKKYLDANPNLNLKISFFDNIDKISSKLDMVIVATNAFSRRNIVEKIYEKNNPKHIILEKFLFPKIEDYKFCKDLFEANNTTAWVNQWMGNEFKKLKEYFSSNKKINFLVSGNNWGLCCNSVHYIDWFHSLINREKIKIDAVNLENEIFDSKRSGYRELFGSYKIISESGHSLILNCRNDKDRTDKEFEINISISNSENCVEAKLLPRQLDYVINDYIKNTNSNEKIHVTFQSERTANIIETLMSLDTCNLVCYQTSIEHHLLIYKMFEKVFISNGDDIKNGLPIT